jgi:hypothetical protein
MKWNFCNETVDWQMLVCRCSRAAPGIVEPSTDLVHELQRLRIMSAGYLGLQGREFGDALAEPVFIDPIQK